MERWRIAHKESNFTIIDNGIFNDPDLTLPEMGFLCKILSLPEGWHFNIEGIVSTILEGKKYVYAIINRLIEHGYCKREQSKDTETGRWQNYNYTFYEVKNGLGCTSAPQLPSRHAVSRDTATPYAVEGTQLNIINNKVHKESSTNKDKPTSFSFLKSLIALGVSEPVATAWLKVRKTKRLTNTEIAFNSVAKEIAKSGRSADDCIRLSVENSWGGFKAEWMPKEEIGYIGDIEAYIQARKNNGTLTQ